MALQYLVFTFDGDICQGGGLQQPLHVSHQLVGLIFLRTVFGIIVSIPQPGHIIARDGHLTDYGQSVLIDELTGDQDVTDTPPPGVMIPKLYRF